MASINDIQDDKVRQLATTLRQSGLAASDTEAIRMAMSMTSTNSRVQQTFDDRKERSTMGLAYLNKEYPNKQQEQKPAPQKVSHEEPKEQVFKPVEQIARPAPEPKPEPIYDLDIDDDKEFIVQDLVKSEEPKAPVHSEPKPQAPQPSQQERVPPRKDISEFAESKVNLANVFNFRK